MTKKNESDKEQKFTKASLEAAQKGLDNLADKNPIAEKKAEAELKKDLDAAIGRSTKVRKEAAYDKVFDAQIKQKQKQKQEQTPEQKEKSAKSRAEFEAFKKKNEKGQEKKPIAQDQPTPKNKPAAYDKVFDAQIARKNKEQAAAFQKKYDEDRSNQDKEVKKSAQDLLIQKNKPLPKTPDELKRMEEKKAEQEGKQAQEETKKYNKVVNAYSKLGEELAKSHKFELVTLKKEIYGAMEDYDKKSLGDKKVVIDNLLDIASEFSNNKQIKGQDNIKNKLSNMTKTTHEMLDNPNDKKAQQAFEKAASDLNNVKIKAPVPESLKDTARGFKEKISNAKVINAPKSLIPRGKGYERI